MIVFIEENDSYSTKIALQFFRHFGFFVTIIDMRYISETFNKYNIVISNKPWGEVSLENNNYSEIHLNNGQKS